MGLVTSSKDDTERTPRDELRRRDRERFAMKSGQPELKRSDLTFGRFDVVHEPTSDRFRVYKGKVDTGLTHPVSAFFYDQAGAVVFPRAPAR